MASAYCWDGIHTYCSPLGLGWREGGPRACMYVACFWRKQDTGMAEEDCAPVFIVCKTKDCTRTCSVYTSSLASLSHTTKYPKLTEGRCQPQACTPMIRYFPFFNAYDKHHVYMKIVMCVLERRLLEHVLVRSSYQSVSCMDMDGWAQAFVNNNIKELKRHQSVLHLIINTR